MRILYVLPGPVGRIEAGLAEMERRLSILRSYAVSGTEVGIADVEGGPTSIESLYEEYLSIPRRTVERMLEMERDGYDAAVLGCYRDPGLDAVREVTERMVVVGPGEARGGTQRRRQNVVNTVLGVGVSNWVLWAVMVLFIAIYFVVTEIMNRREDEARNRGEGE